jgi:hypothetical protein
MAATPTGAFSEDDGLWYEEFDPFTSPPDGDEDWLNDLPAEQREEFLTAPWTGAGEAEAAGFLHHAGGRPGVGFAAGGSLDLLAPGPVLAGFAEEAAGGLDGLGESELVGVLCGFRRLASWAAAREASAVIALARRRAVQARERRRPSLINHIGDEVAAALTLTTRSGDRLVELSAGLARLRATHAALAAGIIDWARASVMVDELLPLDDAAALAVEALVLPRAGGMTTGQLRAALRKAALAADPAADRKRRREARKDTGVRFWQEASGNAAIAGRELSPAEAIAADQRLTAQARWLQARGATGTLDELRAAAFTANLGGRPLTTLLPPGTRPDADTDTDTDADADADSMSPGSPEPGSPLSGRPGQGVACPATGTGSTDGTATTGSAEGSGEPGWAAGITGTVNLTMPLSAWTRQSDAAGEIPGYGPADADTCRQLADWLAAHPGTRWNLIITDQHGYPIAHARARHGPGPPQIKWPAAWLSTLRPQVLEHGTCTHRRQAPGYRPPRNLAHLITTRNRTCTAPGCRRAATRCDLDHTTPYHLGGLTCECNLAPLCRRHHQAKQALGWHLEQREPGTLTWTLPHSRSYTTRPDPYPI